MTRHWSGAPPASRDSLRVTVVSGSKQLRLGGFFSVPGNHLAGWRHPDAQPTYDMDFNYDVRRDKERIEVEILDVHRTL